MDSSVSSDRSGSEGSEGSEEGLAMVARIADAVAYISSDEGSVDEGDEFDDVCHQRVSEVEVMPTTMDAPALTIPAAVQFRRRAAAAQLNSASPPPSPLSGACSNVTPSPTGSANVVSSADPSLDTPTSSPALLAKAWTHRKSNDNTSHRVSMAEDDYISFYDLPSKFPLGRNFSVRSQSQRVDRFSAGSRRSQSSFLDETSEGLGLGLGLRLSDSELDRADADADADAAAPTTLSTPMRRALARARAMLP